MITTILSSCCVKYKNLVYIQDKYENASDTIATSKNQEIVLRTGDNLYINLIGANISDLGIYYRDDRMGSTREFLALQGYMIDPEGNIKFPMIGDVKLAGLTLNEARDLIQSKIDEYIANVVVAVRLLNYDITVLGEVARPGTYTFSQREVNLFDALGMAGDCTPNADRQRVIILRKEAENTKPAAFGLCVQPILLAQAERRHLCETDTLEDRCGQLTAVERDSVVAVGYRHTHSIYQLSEKIIGYG